MYIIHKGLDLPISGTPVQEVDEGPAVSRVALVGDDYVAMKPTLAVQVGESVKQGQLLFEDKKTPGVRYTAPGCGKVVAVNRGAKRKFESIVIELDGEEEETFASFSAAELDKVARHQVQQILIQSGLWTVLRTRPYSKVPVPDSVPRSIFVAAMDTNPLAGDPALIIKERAQDFGYGLQVLAQLTDGPVFVCKRPDADIPGDGISGVSVQEFEGPHPAGLTGTHIHLLDPVSEKKTVWSINYQDAIAVGVLFTTGRLEMERVVSLAGPAVKNPRLIRTRVGADIEQLVKADLSRVNMRVISGSVLSGRQATGGHAFLGRPHLQISAIGEGREREFLGWALAGFNRYSVKALYASALFDRGRFDRARKVAFTSSAEGNRRPMVPIGSYEQVMPLDIDPPYFLRSLIVGDTEKAQALGCLELDEEDLALCAFVCPGKYNYGPLLRDVLTRIEKEG
jgi:Na+-transporting NADH:ubiquinone oxidoreductase subunit A